MSNVVWNAENGWHDGPELVSMTKRPTPITPRRRMSVELYGADIRAMTRGRFSSGWVRAYVTHNGTRSNPPLIQR